MPGNETLDARFRGADQTGFPALASLDDRGQVLWVLGIAKERLGIVWMPPSQIATVLRDVYGVHVSRQRVQGIVAGERTAIAGSRRGGVRSYQIMKVGLDGLLAKSPDVLFIEPDKALTGLRSAQAMMQSLVGLVRFCDPYIESASLDLLAEATKATEIRLLTVNIAKAQVFARDLAAFRKEHAPKIEVRQAAAGTLHDRYAVDDARMLLFGTSLNGIGKKQSFIVELGADLRQTALVAFDASWNAATVVV
jgi:hypothetical protein